MRGRRFYDKIIRHLLLQIRLLASVPKCYANAQKLSTLRPGSVLVRTGGQEIVFTAEKPDKEIYI